MRHLRNIFFVVVALATGSCSSDSGQTPEPDSGSDATMADSGTSDAGERPQFNTAEEAFDHVDPFIGTGGLGFAYAALTPAAQVPFGVVRLGPDTTEAGTHSSSLHHFSGYYHRDPHVRGFSHTHFVGTGAADYGNIRVLPLAEDDPSLEARRWYTGHDRAEEAAEPGYYRTRLTEPKVDVELTATRRVGVHRYTFDDSSALLGIDFASSVTDDGVVDARVSTTAMGFTGEVTFAGSLSGRGKPFTLHFAAKVDPAPDGQRLWNQDGDATGEDASGTKLGLVYSWDDLDAPVDLKVAISFIDGAAAAATLSEEVGDDVDFDDVRERARQLWLERLRRLRVAGGTDDYLTILFTALYNTYRMPTRIDERGEYRGLDGELHDTDHPYYTDLSLWDTYRTLHPWYVVYEPEVQRDVLRTLVKMGEDGGYVPRWPAALSYSGAMEGTSADILFAGSAVKGVEGVDYETAYDLLMKTAMSEPPEDAPFGGRDGLDDYLDLGWVPTDRHSGAASNTLEYAVDDAALAVLAEHLGRPEASEFRERSTYYENVWNDDMKFFLPRNADGSWVTEDFSATAYHERSGVYTEGSAWHWRFYVPHDPEGLAELFGGPDAFVDELETFMSKSRLFEGDRSELFLPDGYYWHTNQPSLHVAYLLGPVGRIDRLSHWVRQIQTYAYDVTPDGLVGNDDGGTLSAWYLFSALGFYPVPGSSRYIVSPPLFEHVEIERPDGTFIRVEADGAAEVGAIESVSIDGEPIEGAYLEHDGLIDATLEYELK